MPDQGKIEELTDSLKGYISTNIELFKHQAIERTTVMVSDLVANLLVGLLFLFFVFFISLWACFYLYTVLGNNYLGIAIVAAFYLLMGMILYLVRKKLIIKPLRNKIVRNIFQKDSM